MILDPGRAVRLAPNAMILEYVKYPLWTVWRFVVDLRLAVRNTRIILKSFLRTVYVGGKTVRTLKRNQAVWDERTKGRYMWEMASGPWARWILGEAEVRLTAVGLERVDWSRPHVVVSNHQSTLDILVVAAEVPSGRFVAKKEILPYPFVGSGCKHGGQILIDRGDHAQAMTAIREGVKAWRDSNLIFFAEGSRTRSGELRPFKKGAFAIAKEAGLDIVPVAISGTFDALPKGSLLRLRRCPRIRIEFGEAFPPEGPIEELADRAHAAVAAMVKPSEAAQRVPAGFPSLQPGS
jgi:1-acyl-sn-glycerol-3-phosphate acyltransferase